VEVRLAAAAPAPDGTRLALRLPDGAQVRARLAAVGAHNGANAAAAAAAASALGVGPVAIAAGLNASRPAKHRSTLIEAGGRKILDDCYNASPLSMAAALETLAALKGEARAVAVLGDMLELGADSPMLHRSIGARLAALGIDALVTLGDRARAIGEAALAAGMKERRVRHAESVDEAAHVVERSTRAGDWILVKGSRGMKLEQVVEALARRLAAEQQS
jgi:UDP-N-acetylmuramyl pentapeptide synthase